jgi:hypothetical protein
MKHIRGLVQKQTSAVMRMDPMMAGLMSRRMAGKKHHSARLTAGVWNRLSEQDKARIRACLDDAAATYHCNRNDLVWAMDGPGGVVHVKKRDQILI